MERPRRLASSSADMGASAMADSLAGMREVGDVLAPKPMPG
jgi:hypothetical protein